MTNCPCMVQSQGYEVSKECLVSLSYLGGAFSKDAVVKHASCSLCKRLGHLVFAKLYL